MSHQVQVLFTLHHSRMTLAKMSITVEYYIEITSYYNTSVFCAMILLNSALGYFPSESKTDLFEKCCTFSSGGKWQVYV